MNCYEQLIKYGEKVITNYIDEIRQEMNEKFDQLEKYNKFIVRSYVENEYNNSQITNFNSLKKIIDLENQLKFLNLS